MIGSDEWFGKGNVMPEQAQEKKEKVSDHPIYDAVRASMGVTVDITTPRKPTSAELKRGKRVTNRVLRSLNRMEVPPSADETMEIMDDATMDVAEPVDPAVHAEAKRNGLL